MNELDGKGAGGRTEGVRGHHGVGPGIAIVGGRPDEVAVDETVVGQIGEDEPPGKRGCVRKNKSERWGVLIGGKTREGGGQLIVNEAGSSHGAGGRNIAGFGGVGGGRDVKGQLLGAHPVFVGPCCGCGVEIQGGQRKTQS